MHGFDVPGEREDYRLKNSSCFYDYYINALSMPSKNGITPIKVTPSSSVHGRV